MITKKSVLFLLLFFSHYNYTVQSPEHIWQKELHLDWSKIDLNDAIFWPNLLKKMPKGMQFGIATSAMQIEGVRTHDNYRAAKGSQGFVENNWTTDTNPKFSAYYKQITGPDHWSHVQEDVQLIKQTGANAYRLSLSWEKIQPDSPHAFDEIAIQHYIDECKALKKSGIEPWICLSHFTFPVWFAQKGGFEKEENINYFVNFARYVFTKFKEAKTNKDLVTYWASYNEPMAYAIEGYFTGNFPPHRNQQKHMLPIKWIYDLWHYTHGIFYEAGVVMKHKLEAHVRIHKVLKTIQPTAQFGLIQLFHPLDAYSSWNPLENLAVSMGNKLTHDSVLDFFKTGHFNWLGIVTHTNKQAPQSLDWIGVNFYRNQLINLTNPFADNKRPGQEAAPDNGKLIYPEGLLRSIAKASELDKPIYITEIGIADGTDKMRNEFLKKHLYVLLLAINKGFNIKGFFIWTLMDSLGWKPGYNSKYGLYAVNTQTNERLLRPGAQPLVAFWKQYTAQQRI